jgi:hypothetical protein
LLLVITLPTFNSPPIIVIDPAAVSGFEIVTLAVFVGLPMVILDGLPVIDKLAFEHVPEKEFVVERMLTLP